MFLTTEQSLATFLLWDNKIEQRWVIAVVWQDLFQDKYIIYIFKK